MKRLAIVTTHPIQYYAPIFKLLTDNHRIGVKVFYTLGNTTGTFSDPGFERSILWDLPVLEGYEFESLLNTAKRPGSDYFSGIVNPEGVAQIQKYQPDALLVFGWAYHAHLQIIRHFSGKVPLYFRGDSTLLNDLGALKRGMRAIFLKWVYRHIDHAFYVGTNNKHYYEKYGLKSRQLSFAPHAVDIERFTEPRTEEATGLRGMLGITPDEILVLYAGKFEPVKNLKLLLTAFQELKSISVHLLLAGSGPCENDLRSMAAVAACSGNIHFLGFRNQTEMPALYQAADLFCLPSVSESWGLSINEAMACGKAILASSRVGCVADLVSEDQNGAVFESDNAASLTEKLAKLTSNKQELVKLGRRSLAIIKLWNFSAVATTVEEKLLKEDI